MDEILWLVFCRVSVPALVLLLIFLFMLIFSSTINCHSEDVNDLGAFFLSQIKIQLLVAWYYPTGLLPLGYLFAVVGYYQ